MSFRRSGSAERRKALAKQEKGPILARNFLAKRQPRKSKQSRKGRTGESSKVPEGHTIRGAQPSAGLSEEICLSEGSAGVSPSVPRGLSEGSSEVSKRGWRTEGVGATKPFKDQRFRPLCCPVFLCPFRRMGTHFWRTFWALFMGLFVANPLPETPLRNLRDFWGSAGVRAIFRGFNFGGTDPTQRTLPYCF